MWVCYFVCNRNDSTLVKSTSGILHLLREIARLNVAYCCYSSAFKEIGQSLKIGAPQFLPIYKTKWHCNSILNPLLDPLWLQWICSEGLIFSSVLDPFQVCSWPEGLIFCTGRRSTTSGENYGITPLRGCSPSFFYFIVNVYFFH